MYDLEPAAKQASEPSQAQRRNEQPAALPCTVLRLQQTAGNRAVRRLLGGSVLQTRLAVGRADDPLEQEADRAADAALREEKTAPIQRRVQCAAGGDVESVPDDFVQRLGSGRALEPAVRAEMEPRFGHDFGDVRIHTGAQADASARSVSAHAFTVGRDVAFAHGQYAPHSSAGRHLLAHELAHVIQQGAAEQTIQRRHDYHGVGGALREQVYEPAEAYWEGQLANVEHLAQAWHAELPVLGYVGGIVAGAPTILAADLALILIYTLELITPLTEEEHFLVGATLGAGEVAIPLIHLGRWITKALARLFTKHPRLAWRILPRIKEVIRAVYQKIAGWLERKAAARARSAPVDPFAKTHPGGPELTDAAFESTASKRPLTGAARRNLTAKKPLSELQDAARRQFGEEAGQRWKNLEAADPRDYENLVVEWSQALHEESKLSGFDVEARSQEMVRFGLPRKVRTMIWEYFDSHMRQELYQRELLSNGEKIRAALAKREAFERQIEATATTLTRDKGARAAWGEVARHYSHWDRVEAYFREINLPEADRRTVLQWLGDIGESGVDSLPIGRIEKSGLPERLRNLISDMWVLGRKGKLPSNPG